MSPDALKALVLYWSAGGNTRKVAQAIHDALYGEQVDAEIREMDEDLDVNVYDWPLVFLGSPVYQFLPPEPVREFLGKQQKIHGGVEPSAPVRPGRFGVVFCTYGGPHTGVREAVPCLKYLGQVLEHSGVPVVDEWAVVGEFHEARQEPLNLMGRLGDIRGRPNESDLAEVRGRVEGLLRRLEHVLPPKSAGDEEA